MANSHIDPPRRRGIVKVEFLENRRRHAATLVERYLSVEADRRLCVGHSYRQYTLACAIKHAGKLPQPQLDQLSLGSKLHFSG